MFLDLEGGFAIVALIVWLIALAEAITADQALVRNLPKFFWIMLILIIFPIGAILWFVLGRPQGGGRDLPSQGDHGLRPPRGGRPAPTGPDDDPGFLDSIRSEKLQSWEDDLLRRERELKRREDPDSGS